MIETADVVRDAIYGYISLSEEENRVYKTRALLRLMGLNPAPSAFFVYPGASGTRFAHSLGAMHLAGIVAENLALRHRWPEEVTRNVRLAALLHDVGHGPFSHTFDKFLSSQRSPLRGRSKLDHEKIGFFLLKNDPEIRRIIPDRKRLLEISYIAWGENRLFECGVPKDELKNLRRRRPYLQILSEIVHGRPHCVDILDFLVRDSHHTGVEYGLVDAKRLLLFADSFRGSLALDRRVFEAYEALMMARYNMFRAVYWHRAARATDLVQLKVLFEVDDLLRERGRSMTSACNQLVIKGKPGAYLALDDHVVYSLAGQIAKKKGERCFSYRLLHRVLPKEAYRRPEKSLDRFIQEMKAKSGFKTEEEIFGQWKQFILKDVNRGSSVRLGGNELFIDTPSLPFIPVHGKPGTTADVVFYERLGTKMNPWPIPEGSILYTTDERLLEFRVYTTRADLRRKIRHACEDRWPLQSQREQEEAGTQF